MAGRFRLLTEPASLKLKVFEKHLVAAVRFRLLTEPASLKPLSLAAFLLATCCFRLLTEPASLKRIDDVIPYSIRNDVSGSSQSRPH